MNRKLITVFDVCAITLIVVLSVAVMIIFTSSDDGKTAVVSVNEQVVAEFALDTPATEKIKTQYGYNTVIISNGECYVSDANCRDGICVNRGRISKIGESIVCLPHKFIVEIK